MDQEDTPLNRLRRWQHGETPGPWYVNWFPTNRCNLRCSMCWRHEFEFDPHDEVPDERLLTMVDELADAGARDWVIAGGGEPLLRQDLILKACRRIRERGMNGNITTNAVLLKTGFVKELMDIGWAALTCSLDGPTAEINDPIRGEGTFERITAAMAQVAAHRREARAQAPYFNVVTCVSRRNYQAIPDMIDLAHRLGFEAARGQLITGYWCADVLSPQQMTELPSIIRRAEERGRELGVEVDFKCMLEWPVPERWRYALLDRVFGKPQGVSAAPCFDPWYSIAILGEGLLAPCCMSDFKDAPRISDMPFGELWTGPFMTHLRETMMRGGKFRFCVTCPLLNSKRVERDRHALRYKDYVDNWDSLNWLQRRTLLAWEAASHVRNRGIRDALKTFVKARP